jgi:protein-tyrosine phosphatase
MRDFRFVPASCDESIIFGAERPGNNSEQVRQASIQEWIAFMKGRGIKRVCCLLRKKQLAFYIDADLLETYRCEFRPENVCWAPVKDYHLCEETMLKERILSFLQESQLRKIPTIVHCSGGSGRTGHVLAAWLVFGREFDIEQALTAVTEMQRNPKEAVNCAHATQAQLYALLEACKQRE